MSPIQIVSDYEFLTKKELLFRMKSEQIIMPIEVENKLVDFEDNTLLAIEVVVNYPAKIINISALNMPIVDFISKSFTKSGLTIEQVNKSFRVLCE